MTLVSTFQSAPARGAATVRGPFSFAFNTAGINNGVTVYTPAVGDVLLDAWMIVDTGFNGTTPKGDIGTFVGTNAGVWKFYNASGPVELGFGDWTTVGGTGLFGIDPNSSSDWDGLISVTAAAAAAAYAPLLVTAANPIKLVVSQTGAKGGTAVGGSAGAGRLYLVTATPVALP